MHGSLSPSRCSEFCSTESFPVGTLVLQSVDDKDLKEERKRPLFPGQKTIVWAESARGRLCSHQDNNKCLDGGSKDHGAKFFPGQRQEDIKSWDRAGRSLVSPRLRGVWNTRLHTESLLWRNQWSIKDLNQLTDDKNLSFWSALVPVLLKSPTTCCLFRKRGQEPVSSLNIDLWMSRHCGGGLSSETTAGFCRDSGLIKGYIPVWFHTSVFTLNNRYP